MIYQHIYGKWISEGLAHKLSSVSGCHMVQLQIFIAAGGTDRLGTGYHKILYTFSLVLFLGGVFFLTLYIWHKSLMFNKQLLDNLSKRYT